MAYADFTLEQAETRLGVVVRPGPRPSFAPSEVPKWLIDQLDRGLLLALMSEKARSEFIVAPILLAVRESSGNSLTIFSGERLDVDPARALVGECDFMLARTEAGVPRLQTPLVAVVEAKRNDIPSGLGQCVAQMVAAAAFNEAAGRPLPAIHGCVTTGEDWQFLSLADHAVTLYQPRFYLTDLPGILGIFYALTQA